MNNDTGEANRLRTEARKMNGLMNKTTCVRLAWSDNDYAPMLEHQLDADLRDDLAQIFPNAAGPLAGIEAATFGDLLFHPQPSTPALRLVKEFAKRLNENAWLAYPEDVATVLYYAAIVAAELRAHTAITDLPREEVLKGYRWSRDLAWIPAKLRQLFDEALADAK